MNVSFAKKISVCLPCMVTASLFLLSVVHGGEVETNQSELRIIQKEIKSLQNKIQRDESSLKKQRDTLQNIEREIASINIKQSQTKAEISKIRKQQLVLNQQADQERDRIKDEVSNLGDLVLSQHAIGHQGVLKLILSQRDPTKLERVMVYYKYLAQLTSSKITQGREQVKALITLELQVTEQQQILDQLLQTQHGQQEQLKDAQHKRKQAIASLDNQLTRSANRIGRLKEDELRIRKLIEGLHEVARRRERARASQAANATREKQKIKSTTIASIKKHTTTTVIRPVIQRVSNDGLGKFKGRLKMPAAGSIRANYGSVKIGSGIKWNGIMLSVNEGEPVRSIHNGQIVYADWFKGFGQLVIVDHGQGYMSLYSHNSQITRFLGEQIKTSDIIAYTGSTGGLTQPGLYFEVRYNGEPEDPMLWVKR